MNGLIPHSLSADAERSGFVTGSEHLVVSDCFSVAEIIFISQSVQLLFGRERMCQDGVLFWWILSLCVCLCVYLLFMLCDTWPNLQSEVILIDESQHLYAFSTSTKGDK